MQSITLKKISEVKKFAEMFVQEYNLKIGDIITLRGNLGAGKTTLCKHIICNLCNKDMDVTSPTFNLVHIFEKTIKDKINIQIWHFDLYRLKNQREVIELGIEDAFENGISLIEWPELILDLLPYKAQRVIDISIKNTDGIRTINIKIQS